MRWIRQILGKIVQFPLTVLNGIGQTLVNLFRANSRIGYVVRGFAWVCVLVVLAGIYMFPAQVNVPIAWWNKTNDTLAKQSYIPSQISGADIQTLPESSIKLGLDLQGGARLVYNINTSKVSKDNREQALDALKSRIESRVNGLGVSGGRVVIEETGEQTRLVAELPGISDVSRAVDVIGQTPELKIYPAKDNQEKIQKAQEKLRKKQQKIQQALQDGKNLDEVGGLKKLQELRQKALPYNSDEAVVTGKQVEEAQVNFDPRTGTPRILVRF
ncbi:MAG: hypothetical protein ABEI13_01310, partial [Candidatus Paceibacteria bacterium]